MWAMSVCWSERERREPVYCFKTVNLPSWILRTNHYIQQIVVSWIRRQLFAAEKHRHRNRRDRRLHESVKRVSNYHDRMINSKYSYRGNCHDIDRINCHTECIEYQEPVYERVTTSVGFNSKPVEKKIFRCSISYVPLIVGGEGSSTCFTQFTNSSDKWLSISQMPVQKNFRIW